MIRLDVDERNLILAQSLYYFADTLAGTFIVVFLFATSTIQTTILYHIYTFSFLLLFIILSGWTLRKISSGTLIRIGLFASSIFFLLLVLLQERAVAFLFPLALLRGFGLGNFWAGFNLNQYIFTNELKRARYFGLITSISNVVRAVAPLFGGILITYIGRSVSGNIMIGYTALFFIIFLILAGTAFFVGKLPQHEAPMFLYRHIFSHKRAKRWKQVLLQQAIIGTYDVALATTTGILIYVIMKSELLLGAVQTTGFFVRAVVSIFTIRLFQKQSNAFWMGAVGMAVAIAIFGVWQTVAGVIAYTLLYSVATPFIDNWTSIALFAEMDSYKIHWREKYHFLMERDIALGLARVFSYVALYFALILNGDKLVIAQHWLYVLPVFPIILAVVVWRYSKNK